MRDVAKGKTAADVKTKKRGRAIVEGGKGTASRTVGLLGGIFTFAVSRKLRKNNPVRGVKRYADKKDALPIREGTRQPWRALRNFRSRGSNASAAVIRLLTFTGARKAKSPG